MTKQKKERTVFRIPVGLKPAMQAEAIRLGFEDGRGPGLSKYFIWLHEEHVKAAEQHIKDVVDDAAGFEPSADYIASLGATVAWESMTPGEQFWFLNDVSKFGLAAKVRAAAGRLAVSKCEGEMVGFANGASNAWSCPSEPGYQARYDAALAYVKEVMDAE